MLAKNVHRPDNIHLDVTSLAHACTAGFACPVDGAQAQIQLEQQEQQQMRLAQHSLETSDRGGKT